MIEVKGQDEISKVNHMPVCLVANVGLTRPRLTFTKPNWSLVRGQSLLK